MLFSFVMPAFKARYLHEAVESIVNQTDEDFELIVVDDASSEPIYEIIDSFHNNKIRYYRNEKNIGGQNLVAQWNHSINYAAGDYIILASDDDVYSPTYVAEFRKLVRKYPDVSVFRPRVRQIDAHGNIVSVDGYLAEYVSPFEYLYYYSRGFLGGGIPQYIFKKNILVDIGGFVESPVAWFSDDLTILYLMQNGVVSCPNILFSFRTSDISISGKRGDWPLLRQKLMAAQRYCLLAGELFEKMGDRSFELTDLDKFYFQKGKGVAVYKARNIIENSLFGKEGLITFVKVIFLFLKQRPIYVSFIWLIRLALGMFFYHYSNKK